MARVEIDEAKIRLLNLVERAEAGEEIVLTRRGEPTVKLVPARKGGGFASLAGVWQGRVRIDDFDEVEVLWWRVTRRSSSSPGTPPAWWDSCVSWSGTTPR